MEGDTILGPEEEPEGPDDSTTLASGEDMESVVRQRGRREQLERQRSEQFTDLEERRGAFSPFSPTE